MYLIGDQAHSWDRLCFEKRDHWRQIYKATAMGYCRSGKIQKPNPGLFERFSRHFFGLWCDQQRKLQEHHDLARLCKITSRGWCCNLYYRQQDWHFRREGNPFGWSRVRLEIHWRTSFGGFGQNWWKSRVLVQVGL